MRTFVILQHVLVTEGSLAYAASENLIFTVFRRLGTDGRTDRVSAFRHSLRFRFRGFPFRGATPPDDSVIVVVVVAVIVIVIIVIVVVIVISPGRGLRVGSRGHFGGRWANGRWRRGRYSRYPTAKEILRVERRGRGQGSV